MGIIDRTKVRKSFDRGACRYEETVIVQKRVVERILAQLQQIPPARSPRRILDVGAGTGMLLRSLRKLYPGAFLAGLDLAPGMGSLAIESSPDSRDLYCVEGDAESLPFADGSFDLVVSTSTFQWLDVLDTAFAEAQRVLVQGGTFLFALFGEGTLHELKSSYRRALEAESVEAKDRTHRFFARGEVAEILSGLGYHAGMVESVFEREYYPDVPSLLRSLRRIGAGNAVSVPAKGLGEKRVMMKMMDAYQGEFFEAQGIPATYEVIYGRAMKV
jgi:malonyl-CoA O-methyltransferase